MTTKIATMTDGLVVRITDDRDGKVIRRALTDEYIGRVFKLHSAWMHCGHMGKYPSMIAAVRGAVAYWDMRKEGLCR